MFPEYKNGSTSNLHTNFSNLFCHTKGQATSAKQNASSDPYHSTPLNVIKKHAVIPSRFLAFFKNLGVPEPSVGATSQSPSTRHELLGEECGFK